MRIFIFTLALLGLVMAWGYQGTPAKSMMVARIWHGVVPKAKAVEYEQYLSGGVQSILKIKNNQGAQIMRRDKGANVEFEVISYWPDRKSIEAYAGKDINKTHHLPRDKEFLVKVEPTVEHFDVIYEKR